MSARKAVEFAKLILAFHNFKRDKPSPKCARCHGSGEYTWQDGHNGDDHTSPCECLFRTRPKLDHDLVYGATADGVLAMAREVLRRARAEGKP